MKYIRKEQAIVQTSNVRYWVSAIITIIPFSSYATDGTDTRRNSSVLSVDSRERVDPGVDPEYNLLSTSVHKYDHHHWRSNVPGGSMPAVRDYYSLRFSGMKFRPYGV